MSTQNRLNRRDFIRLAAVTGTTAVLTACAPAVTSTPQPQPTQAPAVQDTTAPTQPPTEQATTAPTASTKPTEVPTAAPVQAQNVTIRWWSYYEPDSRASLFPGIAKAYTDQHPNVTFEQNHGTANYNEKVSTAFASGDPPELFGIQHYQFTLLAKDKSVSDLTEWYAQSGIKSKVLPAAMAWCSVDGKPYGFSGQDLFASEWYYNTVLFEKAGIQEPTTADEFFAIGPALLKVGAHFPVIFGLADSWIWGGLYPAFQTQTTGISAMIQGTYNKDYHVPGLKDAFDLVGRMFKEGMLPKQSLTVGYSDSMASFAQGDAGIFPAITAQYPGLKVALAKADPAKVKLSLFQKPPLFTAKPFSPWTSGYGMVWAVPTANKNLQATLDFLTYFTAPDQQKQLIAVSGIPPLQETWGGITDPLIKLSVQHMGETTPEGLFVIDYLHPQVMEAINAGMRNMATSNGTSDQILDAMTKAIKAI
jgi:ABC-type glycerol-3-phosphate transport system substrate-binding protein